MFRELLLAFKKAKTKCSWNILSAIFFICILLGLGSLYMETKDLRRANANLQRSLTSIRSVLQTISEEKKASERLVAEKINAQNHLINEQGSNLKNLNLKIDNLKSELETSAYKISVLSARNESLVDFMKGSLGENINIPLPFSYFESDAWNKKKEEIKLKLGLSRVIISGDHSNVTLDYAGAADVHFDAITIKSFGILDTKNNFSNTVYLRAPGLAIIPNNRLEIQADSLLDTIILDGCLSWKKIVSDKDFDTWEVKDVNNDTRELKITSNVVTKKASICDNRYLMAYSLASLSDTPEPDAKSRMPISPEKHLLDYSEKSFGGLGIVIEDADVSAGIKVRSVLGNKPAHKAGIRETDIIIKINDIAVSGMTKEEAVSRMRGPVGTKVKLTVMSSRKNKNETKEYSLERELITGFDLNNNFGTPSDLVWEVSEAEKKFIITPANIANGMNTRTFLARNIGKEPVEPRQMKVTDITGQKKTTWEVLPQSTCTTSQTLPGATCTVIVKAIPVVDGEFKGRISITGKTENPASPEYLILTGYARNIAGKLPDQVIANGDLCPAVGEKAEVVVSSTSGSQSDDGFFDFGYGRHNKLPKLFTAECENWQLGKDEILFCNNPGSGFHTSTMREYASQDINGPWEQVRIEERHISARLICRDGILESVDWSW